ncbi:hypothetical protein [Altibacter lentus]|uniref:hypothetical protein n=1 Tax=Altibacter lentus TaxID=1223410 RepID=UPI0012698141|nr:hypothetical protein [Altibacter lentus]
MPVVSLLPLTHNANQIRYPKTSPLPNNSLVYKTKKVYAKRYYQASEWAEMLPWLDAAYEFSQEKVLFKKG